MADLQSQIEELWSRAGELSPGRHRRRRVGDAGHRPARPRRGPGGRDRPATDEVVVHEWLKTGHPAAVPAAGHGDASRSGPSSTPTSSRSRPGTRRPACGWCPAPRPAGARSSTAASSCMPSYVNIGARVGADTMVDTWATVGSCAQIGARVHLAGRRGHRRRARAAQGRAGDGRGRRHHRQPVHGDPGGPGRARARCSAEGMILNPSIPVIDAETGRGARPGRGAAVVRGRRASRRREYPGGRVLPALRARHQAARAEGERHDKAQLNAGPARAPGRHLSPREVRRHDRPARRSRPSWSPSPRSATTRRPWPTRSRPTCAAAPRPRGGPRRRQRGGPHRPRPAADRRRAGRPPRHGAALRQRRAAAPRGRHPVGPGRGGHEGRPGRHARPGPHGPRAGRRRDLRASTPARRWPAAHNGLLALLARTDPTCWRATPPSWASPPAGVVEAGCQGTMRAVVSLGGRRAHTARPWTGVNAIHRLAPVLDALGRYEPRASVLDGCEYAEQLQAVAIEGGVAGNVVPDARHGHDQPPLRPRPRRRRGRARRCGDLVGGALDPAAG